MNFKPSVWRIVITIAIFLILIFFIMTSIKSVRCTPCASGFECPPCPVYLFGINIAGLHSSINIFGVIIIAAISYLISCRVKK